MTRVFETPPRRIWAVARGAWRSESSGLGPGEIMRWGDLNGGEGGGSGAVEVMEGWVKGGGRGEGG